MLQYILGADGRILLFIQEFLRFQWLNPIIILLQALQMVECFGLYWQYYSFALKSIEKQEQQWQ